MFSSWSILMAANSEHINKPQC
uniref:Uncharacterized protein n=1 Tax=Rhizophora mucronata TaxID=61149 RepID=A0A2P2PZB6_RHIMU